MPTYECSFTLDLHGQNRDALIASSEGSELLGTDRPGVQAVSFATKDCEDALDVLIDTSDHAAARSVGFGVATEIERTLRERYGDGSVAVRGFKIRQAVYQPTTISSTELVP